MDASELNVRAAFKMADFHRIYTFPAPMAEADAWRQYIHSWLDCLGKRRENARIPWSNAGLFINLGPLSSKVPSIGATSRLTSCLDLHGMMTNEQAWDNVKK